MNLSCKFTFRTSSALFKGEWYFFYHINTPQAELDAMGWKGIRRIACYEKFYHNPDGALKMVEHTRKK